MPRLLFIFLDGVGLAPDDPTRNPLARANMPVITDLLEGRRLIAGLAPLSNDRATLLELDACMGIDGRPQSASGQASLLTGRNVPALLNQHYGPKPNADIRELLENDNLFMGVIQRGGSVGLLNAYPKPYFDAIERGRRLYSAIPFAAVTAGVQLRTSADLRVGNALSADFTGEGWAARPEFPPAPVYSPIEAGALLAKLSQAHDLAWFDYWLSDYVGHRKDMQLAVTLLEALDRVLEGLFQAWDEERDLIVVTSDHGNLEEVEGRGHTRNPVPALLIGPQPLRRIFAKGLTDLASVYHACLRALFESETLA